MDICEKLSENIGIKKFNNNKLSMIVFDNVKNISQHELKSMLNIQEKEETIS